ncbi:hypothetical protein [Aminobacter ciceronei]|uniref:hypothetical protein n=1 Tax=Aminobacter ciceronei TaxID=150723 RepID=UPI003F71DBE1
MTGIGERDAIAYAQKQLLTEIGFRIAHLLADRSRRDPQFTRRQREVAGACGDLCCSPCVVGNQTASAAQDNALTWPTRDKTVRSKG